MFHHRAWTSLFRAPLRQFASKRGKTLQAVRSLYDAGTPITMLTAYDYPTALHADRAGVDVVLVGDSLGMVVLGERTTQGVTMEQMLHHCRAARRGVSDALLIADLPFGSYESCVEQGVENAIRIVKECGVDAVKLEGGIARQHVISEIIAAGVAVMGHIGLLPQAVSRAGAFRAVGKSAAEAKAILEDAKAVERAGAFGMVVECVPERVAKIITHSVDIPTFGIGSGVFCSGQVLVYHDMLGIMSHPHHVAVAPRFSKSFVEAGPLIDRGIRDYCEQVRQGSFPNEQYAPYRIPDTEFAEFIQYAHETNHVAQRAAGKRKNRKPSTDETITPY